MINSRVLMKLVKQKNAYLNHQKHVIFCT